MLNIITEILSWFDSVFPRVEDFITTLAAVALLFAAFEFFKQYQTIPQRKTALILAIFFLFDGIDYGVFTLQDTLGSLADLLGIVCDAGVAVTSIIFVFRRKDNVRHEDQDL